MKFVRRCLFLCALALLLLPWGPAARVLLMPNGERAHGELGTPMAGAQVAVTSGAEAAWYNPAGMVKERRTVLAASGFALEAENTSIRDGEGATVRSSPGFFAMVSSPSGSARGHFVSYGFFFTWPVQNRFATRLTSEERVGPEALPAELSGPLDLEAIFPDGILRTETARGFGEFGVFSPGAGLAFSIAPWFRLGFSLRWERVRLAEDAETAATFFAEGAEGSGDSLTGFELATARFVGEGARLIYSVGLQAELARWISLGLTYRLPSEEERGSGRVFFSRTQELNVFQAGVPLLSQSEFVLVEGEDVNFELRSPGELRVGVAFLFDLMTLEFDWIRRGALQPYKVFPAQEGATGIGNTFQTPPLVTSLQYSSSFALGAAFGLQDGGSLLLGVAQDKSGVPGDDAVFRKVDFTTVSGGYFFSRDAFSASMGLTYRTVEERGLSIPQLGGGATLERDIGISFWGLQFGFSYIL